MNAAPDHRTSETEDVRWLAQEVVPHAPSLKLWLAGRFPWLRDVDDVVQTALCRIWRQRLTPAGGSPSSAKAMLFAIARNAAIDVVRRDGGTRGQAVPKSVSPEGPVEAADDCDVRETVSRREELEVLAAAVRALPTRCRQVVTLTKIYGHTEREVAAHLGLSPHTVRTQVERGMARCAAYLAEHGVRSTKP